MSDFFDGHFDVMSDSYGPSFQFTSCVHMSTTYYTYLKIFKGKRTVFIDFNARATVGASHLLRWTLKKYKSSLGKSLAQMDFEKNTSPAWASHLLRWTLKKIQVQLGQVTCSDGL